MKYFKNASSRVHLATQTFQENCQRDSHRPDRKESFSVSVQNQINTKLWWELQLEDMTLLTLLSTLPVDWSTTLVEDPFLVSSFARRSNRAFKTGGHHKYTIRDPFINLAGNTAGNIKLICKAK